MSASSAAVPSSEPPASTEPPTPPSSSGRRGWIIAVAVLATLLVAALVAVGILLFSPGSAPVALPIPASATPSASASPTPTASTSPSRPAAPQPSASSRPSSASPGTTPDPRHGIFTDVSVQRAGARRAEHRTTCLSSARDGRRLRPLVRRRHDRCARRSLPVLEQTPTASRPSRASSMTAPAAKSPSASCSKTTSATTSTPRSCCACAPACVATPFLLTPAQTRGRSQGSADQENVDLRGLEPLTPCMPCSVRYQLRHRPRRPSPGNPPRLLHPGATLESRHSSSAEGASSVIGTTGQSFHRRSSP